MESANASATETVAPSAARYFTAPAAVGTDTRSQPWKSVYEKHASEGRPDVMTVRKDGKGVHMKQGHVAA
jgi:hypothetical protein